MSRKDEINKILRFHESIYEVNALTYLAIGNQKYETIASEIEKLFEGKVEYVVEYREYGNWLMNGSISKNLGVAQALKDCLIMQHPKNRLTMQQIKSSYRIIKRTTIDEIIEE